MQEDVDIGLFDSLEIVDKLMHGYGSVFSQDPVWNGGVSELPSKDLLAKLKPLEGGRYHIEVQTVERSLKQADDDNHLGWTGMVCLNLG